MKTMLQTAPSPTDLPPSRYFMPEERRGLKRLGKGLGALLKTDHKNRRGQLVLSGKHRRKLVEYQAHQDEIDRHMSRSAEILRGQVRP